MLTKPKSIPYEIYVFQHYLRLMEFLLKVLERIATLEQDFETLKHGDIGYQKRFAIVYRVEKKKIIRSNIDLARYVLNILNAVTNDPKIDFKKLYMEETELEKSGKYKEWIHSYDVEEEYYRRRLTLGTYLRDIKELIINH